MTPPTTPQDARCFETFEAARCEKPLGHTGHHRAGQWSWTIRTPERPRWFDRLGAKDLTGKVAL